MQPIKEKVSIFWFRRDLRLDDNHGLYKALTSAYPVLPIFIFDKDILKQFTDPSDRRFSFIYEQIEKLDGLLRSYGSSMFVLHDTSLNAIQKICELHEVQEVYTNKDYEPGSIDRDQKVMDILSKRSIPFYSYKDQVIFEESEIIKNDGRPYTVFTPYSRTWKRRFGEKKLQDYPSEGLTRNFLKFSAPEIPSIGKMGFKKTFTNNVALNIDRQTILNYHKTRDLPALNSTSHASIDLRFGTISPRKLTALASQCNPVFLNELIWREFFKMILFHFPYVTKQCFRKKYDQVQWRNNEKEFENWCRGETGYPLVDAGMRQLNETGWMHNRVRMVTASFLVKHLLVDWRWGDAYFAEKLLDYDLSSNNGNWQWVAGCGSDAAPYFRIFNPMEQARKFDPGEKYIKTWIRDFRPGYLQPIVDHDFARKRALEVYSKDSKEIKGIL